MNGFELTGNLTGSLDVKMQDTIVDGNGYTVSVGGVIISEDYVTLQNFVVDNCPSTGISLTKSNDVLENNSVSNCGTGLYIAGAGFGNVSFCTFNHNTYGVIISSSNNISLTNDLVSGNEYGITVQDSNFFEFERNCVEENTPVGICLISSEENPTQSSYSENNISSNGVGVECSSSGNSFWNNNFLNNVLPVLFPHSALCSNKWDNGSEGNYWSNYVAMNASIRVGEPAFKLAESNIDNHPLTSMFPNLINPPKPVPFWFAWWFWGLAVGLISVGVTLEQGLARIRRRKDGLMHTPADLWTRRIDMLLAEDAKIRKKKIEDFEGKYGITIRRSEDTLEDILKRMGMEKKEE
jgi:parallel beta-helix repeat protein